MKRKTPFDRLIQKVHYEIWVNGKNDRNLLYIQEELRSLKVCYLMMAGFDLKRFYKKAFEHTRKKTMFVRYSESLYIKGQAAYLGYFFFISLLKILAENLDRRNLIKQDRFPNFFEIVFFRNKVSQHWNEYADHIGPSTLVSFGRVSIPLVCKDMLTRGDVKSLKQSITNILRSLGSPINQRLLITSPLRPKQLKKQRYHSVLYKKLSWLSKNKISIPSRLIKDLFLFGFPLPILDVDMYCLNLSNIIGRELTKKHLLSSGTNPKQNNPYHYNTNYMILDRGSS